MNKILSVLAAFAFVLQFSAAQAKEVEVVATGSGDTEEWALNRALDNAVKQSSKVDIVRDAPMVRVTGKNNRDFKADFNVDRTDFDKEEKVKEKDEKA